MSGSAGGNRIPRSAVEKTVQEYIDKVLSKVPGFKSAKVSGSYNTSAKEDFGDIDLITSFEGEDKKEFKKQLAKYLESLPDDIIVPFKSEKYKGKKTMNTGEIVTILYPIVGMPGEFVQVDNIIALSEEEGDFKKTFLDYPAEIQGLILGLVKVVTLEEDPNKVIAKMGIKNIPTLEPNQEYEFNLSSAGLTLRIVTLDQDYKQLDRTEVWKSSNWADVKKLLSDYNIDQSFKDLVSDLKKLKNPRSKNRIKGIFKSMVSIKSGEVNTPKGDNKQMALDTVATLEEKYGSFITDLIRPILEAEIGKQTIAVFPGAFKPPHASHLKAIQVIAPKVNKVYVYVSKQPRVKEGQVPVDASQAMAVWDLYKQKGLIPSNVEIKLAQNATPVLDAYQEFEAHPENKYLAVFGKDEEDRWRSVEKNREKYSNVTPVNIGNLKGLSASGLRTAIKNKDLQAIETFLPKGVTAKEYIQALSKGKKEDLTEAYKGKRTNNGAPGTFKAKITKAYGGDVTIEKAKRFKNRENATALDKQQANWFINFHSNNESITPAELKQADAFADAQLAPIDVDLTSKHVFDRLTGRESDISFAQLIGFFKRLGRNKKEFFEFFKEYDEIVANDKTTNLNIPFLNMTNKAIAKTIMRKPNFMTSSPKMTFEELNEVVTDTEVICDNCGWTWKIADGGDDLYICHNTLPSGDVCAHDNNPDLEEASDPEAGSAIPYGSGYRPVKEDLNEGLYSTGEPADSPIQTTPSYKEVEQELEPYIVELVDFMVKQGLNVTPAPRIEFVEDEENAKVTLGRTAYYDPNNKVITLYITRRHPKDVLRSFAHEMIHHMQNLEGRLENMSGTTNVNEDDYLADIESEAYNNGNMLFRAWENDREGNNSIRNMTGFAPGSYDMQPINEGAYDSITRRVVKDIMAAWKEEYNGQEDTLSYDEEYETQDAKGRPLDFILSADLLVKETEEGTYKVDGGADAEAQDKNDEDDSDFAYLEIRFQVDPRSLPQFWSRIYQDLIDVVRHEIEHLTQMGVNLVPAKETPDDEMLRQMIDWELLPKADYFRLQSELDPMLQGMYLKAKKTRTPFKDVLNDYLDMQEITPEDKENILGLWRKRLKALSLPQF
jgi:predicted nucleotidyltransferase